MLELSISSIIRESTTTSSSSSSGSSSSRGDSSIIISNVISVDSTIAPDSMHNTDGFIIVGK